MIAKEVLLKVLLSVTSGYNVGFTVPFDCSLHLFAAETTNLDAFNCILWYSLNLFQVSLLSIFSVAPESNKKSISRCSGEMVFVWSCVCCLYTVNGSTLIFLLQKVERIYFSVIVLHSYWQLKYSSWASWFNSKSKSLNCCSRSVSSSVVSVLDVVLSVCS